MCVIPIGQAQSGDSDHEPSRYSIEQPWTRENLRLGAKYTVHHFERDAMVPESHADMETCPA